LLAGVDEADAEVVADLPAHRAGDGDAARRRNRLETRRDVDAVACDVVLVDEDVAEVDADAVIDAPAPGQPAVALGHGALDLDRRLQRRQRARELDQEAVAHRAHDAAAMAAHGGVGDLGAGLEQARVRAGLVALHQPAVAGDVGDHHGGKPARRRRAHPLPKRRAARSVMPALSRRCLLCRPV